MNKYELNEQIFDQVLKYVAEEKMENMAKDFPSKDELDSKIMLSSEFKKNMERFIKKLKHKERTLNFGKRFLKVGVIAVACMLVCFTAVYNVEALRVPFLNFFNNINQQSTTIHVQDDENLYSSFGDQIKGLYLPDYIPELYKVKSINRVDKNYNVLFKNSDGLTIELRAMAGGSSAGVDSENADAIQIIVNGEQAQYYSKNGDNILIFEYDANAFLLDGPISKEELIKIAESMKNRT